MLVGAIASGVATWQDLVDLTRTYRAADPALRRFMLYGPNLPLLDKVERQVPRGEGLLLDAEVDPALLGYALFPRPIWQPAVDPELRVLFRGIPASPYPRRDPEAFPVKWLLRVTPDNLAQGGDLLPLRKAAGAGR